MITQPSTIFIVDDEPAVCKALSWLFRSAQFHCETYTSGKAFLAAYDAARTGCILIDIEMPEMSGLELQQHLLALNNPLPIIFISGHADSTIIQRVKHAGAVDLVNKPFNNNFLLDKVKQAITSK